MHVASYSFHASIVAPVEGFLDVGEWGVVIVLEVGQSGGQKIIGVVVVEAL
jgi:hypothetical protein